MVYPLLPAFVTGTLGGGAALLGLLDGAADLTSAVLKVVSGRLADRPRWRAPLILVGYATAVLVRPLIAVAGAAWQVVGFRVVDRVGKGLRTPPRDALIAGITPPALRGRAFGFHRAADHFGAVLGSLAAWYLLSRGIEVRRVIEWSVVPGLVAFAVLAAVLRGARAVPAAVPAIRGDHRRGRAGLLVACDGADGAQLFPGARGAAAAPAPGRGRGRGRGAVGVGGTPRGPERELLSGRMAVGPPRPARHRGGRRPACSRPSSRRWARRSGRPRRWSLSSHSASWPDLRSRPSGRWWPAWPPCGPDAGSACIMR